MFLEEFGGLNLKKTVPEFSPVTVELKLHIVELELVTAKV